MLKVGDEDLVYICVAVWPKGIPKSQKDWRRAYKLGSTR